MGTAVALVLILRFHPAGFGAPRNYPVNLGGFAGKDGDVIVVVLDRGGFRRLPERPDRGPLEERDVRRWIRSSIEATAQAAGIGPKGIEKRRKESLSDL